MEAVVGVTVEVVKMVGAETAATSASVRLAEVVVMVAVAAVVAWESCGGRK